MKFSHCVSLGSYCETAYQTRRKAGDTRAYFFDWLVVPFASLLQVMDADFAGVFERDNLRLHDNGMSVVDTQNGLFFHHDFSRDENNLVTEAIIDREYKVARTKVQFLLQRWRAMARGPDPVLYVTLNDEKPADVLRLQQIMRARYPDHAFSLLWVRRPEHPGFAEEQDGIIQAMVPGAPDGPKQWEGDNPGWDQAFAKVGL